MKFDPDCIRDVLLYLEDNLTYINDETNPLEHKPISIGAISDTLSSSRGYSIDDIYYSIEKLLEVRYILPSGGIGRGRASSIIFCEIGDISWSGHEFLNNIRKDAIWDATKKGAHKIGATSIMALGTISMEIVKTIVTKPEVINQIMSTINFG